MASVQRTACPRFWRFMSAGSWTCPAHQAGEITWARDNTGVRAWSSSHRRRHACVRPGPGGSGHPDLADRREADHQDRQEAGKPPVASLCHALADTGAPQLTGPPWSASHPRPHGRLRAYLGCILRTGSGSCANPGHRPPPPAAARPGSAATPRQPHRGSAGSVSPPGLSSAGPPASRAASGRFLVSRFIASMRAGAAASRPPRPRPGARPERPALPGGNVDGTMGMWISLAGRWSGT